MACNRGRFEAVVFSVHVDLLMAQGFLCCFFFFLPNPVLHRAVFPAPALQANPHSACQLWQDGLQAATGH